MNEFENDEDGRPIARTKQEFLADGGSVVWNVEVGLTMGRTLVFGCAGAIEASTLATMLNGYGVTWIEVRP